MALVQVKHANKTVHTASVNVISEIHQIIYSLYLDKEFRKKVYNNLMSLIELWYKTGSIFMNSENNKIYDFHNLITQSYR